MNTLYEQLLLYPDRAENLGQFARYDVDLDHWAGLSTVFRQTFRAVYERGSSAILLVHGAQGTGKTLFSRRLADDYDKATRGALQPDKKNLWHTLVGGDPLTQGTIERATHNSVLRRVESVSGWLDAQRTFAKSDPHRVRIFVIDDAHKDVFMREWAGLTQAEYLGFKERKTENVTLSSVAERLVEDCRGDFLRSIFLLLSNDAGRMTELKNHADKSHAGLGTVLELPLPDAKTKEQIIRKNTNRLNRMSYWFCLDAAGKDERLSTYNVLTAESGGFTDCFSAVDQALRSSSTNRSSSAKRPGRPANRNQITLVTLGALPSTAQGFLDDVGLGLSAERHHRGAHIGMWWMREQWASILYEGNDSELSRRARMVESEFALRWVALDIHATHALCMPPSSGDLGERLLDLIRLVPSIAKPDDARKHGGQAALLDEALEREATSAERDRFADDFRMRGQGRSSLYEPALARRLDGYGRGLAALAAVKPDFIAHEYRPCAVTSAASSAPGAISDAIRRTCHVIEFTAHLKDDMANLRGYLLEKIERYAQLLESV